MAPRKKNDKAELAKPASFTITIASTEANLQRIAALLMFADRDKVELNYDDCAFPWEEQKGPPKPVELDYNTIRKDIVGLVQKFLDINQGMKARALFEDYGAKTLREVKEPQLLPLWEAMRATLKLLGVDPDA